METLRLIPPAGHVLDRCFRRLVVALPFFERLLRNEAGLYERLSALEIGLGEYERASSRGDFGLGSRQPVLRGLQV